MELIDKNDLTVCLKVLNCLNDDPDAFAHLTHEDRVALLQAAGRFSRPDRAQAKNRSRAAYKKERREELEQDRTARAATGIREARKSAVFTAPLQLTGEAADAASSEERHLKFPRNCYVCKAEFTKLHFFYDAMCPSCADYNYQKRFQTASLQGRVAVITGSRLKIGYHATLLMLRAGATVIATTRFPVDSALRFSREPDYPEWRDRLKIYGLDLRHTPSVEIFAKYLERTLDRLDILINNAAQTVRRPPGFYAHMLENEFKPLSYSGHVARPGTGRGP
jgi:short chain dehydrogenase